MSRTSMLAAGVDHDANSEDGPVEWPRSSGGVVTDLEAVELDATNKGRQLTGPFAEPGAALRSG